MQTDRKSNKQTEKQKKTNRQKQANKKTQAGKTDGLKRGKRTRKRKRHDL